MKVLMAGRGKDRRLLLGAAAAVLVLIVLVTVGSLAAAQVGPFAKTSDTWSAVFLKDNEVFFGHVKSMDDERIDLVDVYYLQKSSSAPTSTDSTQPSAQLAILGLVANQIQCPTDELIINRVSVLNLQELQSSSFVVTRLNTLVKTPQNCFKPSAASPAPAGNAPASPSATPTP